MDIVQKLNHHLVGKPTVESNDVVVNVDIANNPDATEAATDGMNADLSPTEPVDTEVPIESSVDETGAPVDMSGTAEDSMLDSTSEETEINSLNAKGEDLDATNTALESFLVTVESFKQSQTMTKDVAKAIYAGLDAVTAKYGVKHAEYVTSTESYSYDDSDNLCISLEADIKGMVANVGKVAYEQLIKLFEMISEWIAKAVNVVKTTMGRLKHYMKVLKAKATGKRTIEVPSGACSALGITKNIITLDELAGSVDSWSDAIKLSTREVVHNDNAITKACSDAIQNKQKVSFAVSEGKSDSKKFKLMNIVISNEKGQIYQGQFYSYVGPEDTVEKATLTADSSEVVNYISTTYQAAEMYTNWSKSVNDIIKGRAATTKRVKAKEGKYLTVTDLKSAYKPMTTADKSLMGAFARMIMASSGLANRFIGGSAEGEAA